MWTLCPTTSSPDECWRCLVCDLKSPWNPQQKSIQKKGWKIEFFAVFGVLEGQDWIWGSMSCPPQEKTLKPWEWRYFLKSFIIIYAVFIFMLISRFWRVYHYVYHPHWKKVKGFFKNPMKDLWHLGWILDRPAVDHSVIFRLHHHENLISKIQKMDDVKIIYSNNGWYECQDGACHFLFSCSQDVSVGHIPD